MNKLMGAALLGVAVSAAVPAQADDYLEMRPYVSGMFSYVFEQDDRDDLIGGNSNALKAGQGLQIGVGKAINRWFGVEISAFGDEYGTDQPGVSTLRDYGGKVDGLFFYDRKMAFSPYFGVGLGGVVTELRSTGSSSTDPFADIGLGLMKFFDVSGTDLGFRAELRYRHIFFDSDALGGRQQDDVGEPVLRVGLVVPLGARPVAAPPPPAACPDSDGDGVCDTADLCPETPAGTEVDAKGCPVDVQADKGDPEQKFEDVHFAFDKYELTDYAKALLDNAASVINDLTKSFPELKVDVAGHTDSVGTDGYNQGLSERRANAVKQYLLRKGVDGERITTQAYGEARPKATNDTAEGRALNRRAEVRTHEK